MNYKKTKIIFLLFFGLTLVNSYSQKCQETLELINQSDEDHFSDASLQYNIVKYLECIQAPQKKNRFF